MSGWIKLHREINKHWIWDNSDYLKWWLDMLLEVNHSDSKVVIKNKIYECKRGEKMYSLDTWAMRWKTNKSKVRRFFELLQNDNMIVIKNETQTTRITICNYDSYQDEIIKSETQTKRKRNASETHLTPIKELNNDKNKYTLSINERKLKFASTLEPFLETYGREMLNDFYRYWTEENKSNTKFRAELEKTWNVKSRLTTWAKNDLKFKGTKVENDFINLPETKLIDYLATQLAKQGLFGKFVDEVPDYMKRDYDKLCKNVASFIKKNIDLVKNRTLPEIVAMEKSKKQGSL